MVDLATSSRPTRPRGYPLVGLLPSMIQDGPLLFRRLTWEHPGQVLEVDLGVTRLFLVTHPEHAQYVLVDAWRNFTKASGMWRPIRRLLGEGIFTATGDTWFRNRRLMQPLFATKQLAALVEPMLAVAEADVDELVALIDQGPVDMGARMMRMTQRVILATMFGSSLPTEQSDRLAEVMLRCFEAMNARLFLHFMPDRLMPGERAFQTAIALLDRTILDIVAERRRTGEQRNDLLSLLLAARDEAGTGMDDRQLRDELVTMFVAGNETLAITMTWLLYMLDTHAEVDRKVQRELDEVLGDRPPTAADLPALDYSRRVIQETMRLYPPSWFIPRMAEQADVIGGYAIPARATVAVSQYALHHDPSVWESPLAFDPDRFLPERVAARPRCSYIPFGVGPRQCIGTHFAMMEAQVLLACLRRRVRARLVPGHPMIPHAATTLRPRHGLRMTLHPA
jgi:cytochrome P450